MADRGLVAHNGQTAITEECQEDGGCEQQPFVQTRSGPCYLRKHSRPVRAKYCRIPDVLPGLNIHQTHSLPSGWRDPFSFL